MGEFPAICARYESGLDQDAVFLCSDGQFSGGPEYVLEDPGRNQTRVEPPLQAPLTFAPIALFRFVRQGRRSAPNVAPSSRSTRSGYQSVLA
jgi:hypothetical protein